MTRSVPGRPHNRETLAAFLDGETRQVYARRLGDLDGPVLFLPDGGKDAFVAEHAQQEIVELRARLAQVEAENIVLAETNRHLWTEMNRLRQRLAAVVQRVRATA